MSGASSTTTAYSMRYSHRICCFRAFGNRRHWWSPIQCSKKLPKEILWLSNPQCCCEHLPETTFFCFHRRPHSRHIRWISVVILLLLRVVAILEPIATFWKLATPMFIASHWSCAWPCSRNQSPLEGFGSVLGISLSILWEKSLASLLAFESSLWACCHRAWSRTLEKAAATSYLQSLRLLWCLLRNFWEVFVAVELHLAGT